MAGVVLFCKTIPEFQLLNRSSHDMRRVPPFVLLFVIIGEWLPLVVVFVDNIVPWPCRIPRQVEHAERKRHDQRLQGRRLLLDTQPHSQRLPRNDGQLRPLDTLHLNLDIAANDFQEHGSSAVKLYLHHALANFNLRSPNWDRGTAYSGVPWPRWKHKLMSHLTYVVTDDALLLRDGGGVGALNAQNVFLACSERGIDVMEKDGRFRADSQLRQDLQAWLDTKRSSAYLKLFRTGRPH